MGLKQENVLRLEGIRKRAQVKYCLCNAKKDGVSAVDMMHMSHRGIF